MDMAGHTIKSKPMILYQLYPGLTRGYIMQSREQQSEQRAG